MAGRHAGDGERFGKERAADQDPAQLQAERQPPGDEEKQDETCQKHGQTCHPEKAWGFYQESFSRSARPWALIFSHRVFREMPKARAVCSR